MAQMEDGKESDCNAGDPGSVPGLGISPGEGNGNPLQYSCLENPMDRRAWWATVRGIAKSRTRLSDFTFFHFHKSPCIPTAGLAPAPPRLSEHIKHKNITTVVCQASASCWSWHWVFHSLTLQSLQYAWIYTFGPGS